MQAKTAADVKKYHDNKKKREAKLNASGDRRHVIPPKTEPTLEGVCNFFGLPKIEWIGMETLKILPQNLCKPVVGVGSMGWSYDSMARYAKEVFYLIKNFPTANGGN